MKCFAKFAIVAISLFAAWSCTEDPIEVPVSKSEETFSMSFSADIFDIDTKATLETTDEINFKAAWEDGDKLDIISANGLVDHLTAIWNAANKVFVINDIPVELKGQKINIHAIYPKTAPAQTRTQTGGVYNDEYDTMEGDAEFEFSTTATGNIVQMQRITAILYFHLTSELNDEISSAKLTVGDQEISTGYVDVNADDAVLWFNISPVENAAISLELTSKNGNTLTLNRKSTATYVAGKVYTIKKKVEWVAPVPVEKYFVKVTEEPADWSGEYLIVSEDFGIALNGNVPASSMHKAANMIAVSPEDDKIPYTDDLLNATVVIDSYQSGYSLKTKGANYIGHVSTSNTGISGENNPILNKVAWSDGNVIITCDYQNVTYTIAANPNPTSAVNSPLINYYKTIATTYKPISLFKKVSVDPVVTKYNVAVADGILNGTVTVNPTQAVEGQTVTITATPASGYKVKSVSAKTASGKDLLVADNEFAMPAEAVTVYAEFEDNGGVSEHTVTYTLSNAGSPQKIDANITVEFDANDGTVPAWYDPEVRTYEKNITKLSCDGGVITSIVFTYTISNSGSLTASTGTYNSSTKTWTGSDASVSFTTGHSSGTKNGQVRISKIEVHYTK